MKHLPFLYSLGLMSYHLKPMTYDSLWRDFTNLLKTTNLCMFFINFDPPPRHGAYDVSHSGITSAFDHCNLSCISQFCVMFELGFENS